MRAATRFSFPSLTFSGTSQASLCLLPVALTPAKRECRSLHIWPDIPCRQAGESGFSWLVPCTVPESAAALTMSYPSPSGAGGLQRHISACQAFDLLRRRLFSCPCRLVFKWVASSRCKRQGGTGRSRGCRYWRARQGTCRNIFRGIQRGEGRKRYG